MFSQRFAFTRTRARKFLSFGILATSLCAMTAQAGNIAQPCINNPTYGCVITYAYDQYYANHWYNDCIQGSCVSNGLPNTPVYTYVNGVYTGELLTNNTDNPGVAVSVTPVNVTFASGAAPNNSTNHGNCSPAPGYTNLTVYVAHDYAYGNNGGGYESPFPFNCSNHP